MSTTTRDHCTDCVARTNSVIGDKWTPLIIRALSQGPSRFCNIQDAAGGVNPRTLSARLDRLEEQGIIGHTRLEDSPHGQYSLTTKGEDLLPILTAMHDWGKKHAAA